VPGFFDFHLLKGQGEAAARLRRWNISFPLSRNGLGPTSELALVGSWARIGLHNWHRACRHQRGPFL